MRTTGLQDCARDGFWPCGRSKHGTGLKNAGGRKNTSSLLLLNTPFFYTSKDLWHPLSHSIVKLRLSTVTTECPCGTAAFQLPTSHIQAIIFVPRNLTLHLDIFKNHVWMSPSYQALQVYLCEWPNHHHCLLPVFPLYDDSNIYSNSNNFILFYIIKNKKLLNSPRPNTDHSKTPLETFPCFSCAVILGYIS